MVLGFLGKLVHKNKGHVILQGVCHWKVYVLGWNDWLGFFCSGASMDPVWQDHYVNPSMVAGVVGKCMETVPGLVGEEFEWQFANVTAQSKFTKFHQVLYCYIYISLEKLCFILTKGLLGQILTLFFQSDYCVRLVLCILWFSINILTFSRKWMIYQNHQT